MPFMISSWSVTGDVSLLVSKSKLICRSLISVDNEVNRICLVTQQGEIVSVRHTPVILLMWRVLHI